jgi:hypothetical protein
MADVVDSNQQLLKAEEILQKGATNTRSPYPFDKVMKSISAELQQPGTQYIRQGNTLFIVHFDKGRHGHFRAINADTAANYITNSWLFIKACYELGYDYLTTEFYDKNIAMIFNAISKKPPYPDMGYDIKQEGTKFVGKIVLGPERGGKI